MKFLPSFGLFALVVVAAGNAGAQCAFDAVGDAKGLRSSMIRAFAGCPTVDHPVVNTMTGAGVPACDPAAPASAGGGGGSTYSFGEKGSCTFETRTKVERDCAALEDAAGEPLGLPAGACHVTSVKCTCKGVVQADGVTPIRADQDGGWSLSVVARFSIDDPDSGDVTLVDLPMEFLFDDPNNGTLKLLSSTAEALPAIMGATAAALPTCTQMQIIRATLDDPQGQPFAKLGAGTR